MNDIIEPQSDTLRVRRSTGNKFRLLKARDFPQQTASAALEAIMECWYRNTFHSTKERNRKNEDLWESHQGF